MDAKAIIKKFTYVSPEAGRPTKYQTLRDLALNLALSINDCCPEGREKSLAMTKLEEAIMWVNASLAGEIDVPAL